MDKKAESAKAVGYCCTGFSILVLFLAIYFMAAGREHGVALLVVGLCLLAVGMTTLASAKKAA